MGNTRRYYPELTGAHLLVLELGGLVTDQLNKALKSLEDKDVSAARDRERTRKVYLGIRIQFAPTCDVYIGGCADCRAYNPYRCYH